MKQRSIQLNRSFFSGCSFLLKSVILLSLSAGFVFTQSGEISIESKIDKASITIGDPVNFTIKVNKTKDIKVDLPGLNVALGAFDVRDYKSAERPVKGTNKTELTISYIITTYKTGQYYVPPITLHYLTPANEQRSVTSDSICIEVKSVKSSEAKDIQEAKDPVPIKASHKLLYWVIGITVVILLGLLGYYYYLRRRWMGKGLLFEKSAESVQPPHEIAFEELAKIEQMGLVEQKRIKEYYTLVADVIRNYSARRYQILTLERTSDEIIQEMRSSDIMGEFVEMFRAFFKASDLVKFAKYIPSNQEIMELVPQARSIVDLTKEVVATALAGQETQPAVDPAALGGQP